MFEFAVDNPVRGVLNGVAPIPVTNTDFTQTLADVDPANFGGILLL